MFLMLMITVLTLHSLLFRYYSKVDLVV